MPDVSIDLELDDDALYFIPLGGSEQFGVNLNVYASKGQYMIVDCGLGFADERFPGIDLLLPDPAFLEQRRENLAGMIITHAHEDHIGAVAHLWERLECPIYATAFTAEILRKKLEETNLKKVPIHVINPMGVAEIGPFKAQFVPVTHSVPGTCSIIIETPQGRVVHSGDWNLDATPVLGDPTDPTPFKQAGDDGVVAYIGDSTNAEVMGRAGSESDVEKGLEKEFENCTGRIAVTSFSSNISRIISIARAAQKSGRRVGVIGRSLHRMIGVAKTCGYMNDVPDIMSEEEIMALAPSKVVVIVTGSQGESRAALARISRGDHPHLKLQKEDTVIFSARAIPGNERQINAVKNNLVAAKVNIITPSDTDNLIHVSGHPCRDEIADMLSWIRPDVVVPVHGERAQLEAHARFARECQVKNTIVPINGSVIKLAPGKAEIIDHVPTDLLAVDLRRIIKSSHQSIVARRKLQYTGAVHFTVVLDERGEILGDPQIDTIGLIDEKSAEIKIEDRLLDMLIGLVEDIGWDSKLDDDQIEEELRIAARRFVVQMLGLKPKTTIHLMRV